MTSLFDDLPLPGFERPAVGSSRRPEAAQPLPTQWSEEAPPADEPYDDGVPYDPGYGAEEDIPDGLFATDHAAETERDAWYRNGSARTVVDPAQLLEGMNDPQREAVLHHGSPLLIVAGAGSGKTRVLT